jgi:hypothetical protein
MFKNFFLLMCSAATAAIFAADTRNHVQSDLQKRMAWKRGEGKTTRDYAEDRDMPERKKRRTEGSDQITQNATYQIENNPFHFSYNG